MALNRVDYPVDLTAQADFSAHGDLIETRFIDQSAVPLQVVGGEIPQGVVFQIGGVVYRGDTATAITGTASAYVKITPAGATASAAYVPDLTGVTWSAQYAGYYDASSNLYVFDEGKALAAGDIASVFGRYLMQQATGDVQIGRDIAVQRNAAVTGTLGVTGAATMASTLGVTGATTLADTLAVTSNATVGGTLGVTGAITGHTSDIDLRISSDHYLRRNASVFESEVYSLLSASVPSINDAVRLSGGYTIGSKTGFINASHAVRTDATTIRLYGTSLNFYASFDALLLSMGNINEVLARSGNGNIAFSGCTLSW